MYALKKLRLFHCYSALDFCAILLWDEFSHEILSFAVLQMWHHQCHNNPSPRHYGNCRKIAMHPCALTAIAKRLARKKLSKHAASNLWAHDGKRYSNTLRRSNSCERLDRREVSKAQVSMWMHGIIAPPCRMTTCSARMTFSSCRRMSGFSVASGPLTFALYQEAAVYADIKWQCRTILRLHCLFACMSEQLHCLLVRQAQQSSERSTAMNGVASWVAFPPWVSTKKERRYEGMSSSVCFGKFMHPSSSPSENGHSRQLCPVKHRHSEIWPGINGTWSNYSDLTRPHPKWWFSKGHPLIWKSRLVKYYNLARWYRMIAST